MLDTFCNKEDKEDLGDESATLARFVTGDDVALDVGASRLGATGGFSEAALRAFTLAFQLVLTKSTRSRILLSLGPLKIRCFSILPTSLPKPVFFTIAAVTGNSAIFFKRCSKKSIPPKDTFPCEFCGNPRYENPCEGACCNVPIFSSRTSCNHVFASGKNDSRIMSRAGFDLSVPATIPKIKARRSSKMAFLWFSSEPGTASTLLAFCIIKTMIAITKQD